MRLRSGTNVFNSRAIIDNNIPQAKLQMYNSLPKQNPVICVLTMTSALVNTSSPLLALPQEIKNAIYNLVFGRQFIHIFGSTRSQHSCAATSALSHHICRATLTEFEAQDAQDCADPDAQTIDQNTRMTINHAWSISINQNRHDDCYLRDYNDFFGRRHQISLSLLRACRQIYFEAKNVPYTHNTFLFHLPFILERFIKQRMQYQHHHLIRSIFIDMGLDHEELQDYWTKIINKCVLQKLKYLRCLHVGFEQNFCDCWIRDCTFDTAGSNKLYQTVCNMGRLRLDRATVVISDGRWREDFWDTDDLESAEDPYRWTLAKKQEFSRDMRKALLSKEKMVKKAAKAAK